MHWLLSNFKSFLLKHLRRCCEYWNTGFHLIHVGNTRKVCRFWSQLRLVWSQIVSKILKSTLLDAYWILVEVWFLEQIMIFIFFSASSVVESSISLGLMDVHVHLCFVTLTFLFWMLNFPVFKISVQLLGTLHKYSLIFGLNLIWRVPIIFLCPIIIINHIHWFIIIILSMRDKWPFSWLLAKILRWTRNRGSSLVRTIWPWFIISFTFVPWWVLSWIIIRAIDLATVIYFVFLVFTWWLVELLNCQLFNVLFKL